MPQTFFGVRVGRRPGIYTDLLQALKQTSNFPSADMRMFSRRYHAELYVDAGVDVSYFQEFYSSSEEEEDENEDDEEDDYYYDHDSESSDTGGDDEPLQNVYVDGSCLGNGMYASKAGFGIWYGPDDRRNTSVTIKHGRKTNNRTELEAIMWAINREIDGCRRRELVIHTDSKYAINCLTVYYSRWEKNGFLNANGRPVVNQELIRECRESIVKLEDQGSQVRFVHVPGHSGHEGNEAANLLAIQGAKGQGNYKI